MRKEKKLKIGVGALILIIVIFAINVFITIDKVGEYSLSKPYEELTFTEKIASKLGGYNIKTRDELKKDEEKAVEDARREKLEQAKKEGTETAKRIESRIKEGNFTMEQYIKFHELLAEKLKNNEITIEELNETDEKLSNGEIKIEDYLK